MLCSYGLSTQVMCTMYPYMSAVGQNAQSADYIEKAFAHVCTGTVCTDLGLLNGLYHIMLGTLNFHCRCRRQAKHSKSVVLCVVTLPAWRKTLGFTLSAVSSAHHRTFWWNMVCRDVFAQHRFPYFYRSSSRNFPTCAGERSARKHQLCLFQLVRTSRRYTGACEYFCT